MKICLINPPVNQHYAPLNIPLQLLILATIAQEAGFESHIIDFNLLTKCDPHFPLSGRFFEPAVEYVRSYSPHILGISCISSTMPFALEIARRYKEKAPSCKIILGGPQATLLHDKILENYPFIDMVCRGEGEFTFKEVLLKGDDLGDIAGLSYRLSSGCVVTNQKREMMNNLDNTPIPNYDLIDLYKYKKMIPEVFLQIEAGRGCPHACSYCSTSLVWERMFRLKSISRLSKEIKEAIEKTGILKFHFVHDLFSFDNSWVFRLCETLISMDEKISWTCDTRPDKVTPILLNKMAKSGCNAIFFGIETGSKSMQKKIGKVLDLDKSVEIVKESINCGLKITTSFILGYPSETLNELNDTMDYIMLFQFFKIPVSIVINSFTPEYGTKSYRLCENRLELNSYIIKRDLPFLTKDIMKLIESDTELFSHYYNPTNKQYDFHILIKLINVLSVVRFMDPLKNVLLFLTEIRTIDIFIALYGFIEDALHFDEYHNARYDCSKLYEGIVSYLGYLHKTHDYQIDKRIIDKQKIYKMVKRLNEHGILRRVNVKRKNP